MFECNVTIEASGGTEAALEDALREAAGRLQDGYLSGADSNDDSSFSFEVESCARPALPDPVKEGEVEFVDHCEATESGFALRKEGGDIFKAEEWRHGDIVDNHYGSWPGVCAWVEKNKAEHLSWRAKDALSKAGDMLAALGDYLRDIQEEKLDGSEPALNELLDNSDALLERIRVLSGSAAPAAGGLSI